MTTVAVEMRKEGPMGTEPVGHIRLTNIPRKGEMVWIDFKYRDRREFTVVQVIHSVAHDQIVLLLREHSE